jgi:predicted metal-dependent peptidase
MDAETKIIRGKVLLQKENPFFAYLVLHLKQQNRDEVGTIGVDFRGNLLYNKKFIEDLNDYDTRIVLCHEVLHVALNHLTRRGNRNEKVWNMACDLIVNTILQMNFNYFSRIFSECITKETLEKNFGIVIEKPHEKFAEEVYDILIKHFNEDGNFRGYVDGYVFDKHSDIDSLSEEEKEELERACGKDFDEIKREIEEEIKKKVIEAENFGKLRGTAPAGLERYFDKLLQPKLNWKTIIRRTISDMIPYDFSYKYPSKKSISVGTYLPSTQKDKKLEVVCVVDLSGSITDEEMKEFLTEIYNIGKSFRNVRISVITHDAVPQDEIEVENGCLDKLVGIKLHGYGGTSHAWLPEFLKEKYPNSKLIICFTDGYTEFPDKSGLLGREIIWVLSKGGVEEKEIPFGRVVRFG